MEIFEFLLVGIATALPLFKVAVAISFCVGAALVLRSFLSLPGRIKRLETTVKHLEERVSAGHL